MGNILATCCRTEEADEKNKEISQKGEVPISRNLIKDTEKSPILKREVEGICLRSRPIYPNVVS